jgi:hypothetical protein
MVAMVKPPATIASARPFNCGGTSDTALTMATTQKPAYTMAPRTRDTIRTS